MYSNKKSILHLVALLKANDIRKIVISPGARNMPIAHSFAVDSFFECYSILDERSAGFFAIGLSLSSNNECIALCCTSGSAALNYAPAIAEAYYSKISLLIITADRPEMWIGQLENQVITQRNIFGSLVKMSVHLPEIKTKDDEWYCNRLINEALLELNHHVKRPVHINIPLSEPLFEYTVEELPEVRVITRDLKMSLNNILFEDIIEYYSNSFKLYKFPLIVIGQGNFYTGEDILKNDLFEWLHEQGCIVFAEHTANMDYCPFIIRNFDTVLQVIPEEDWVIYAPDLLITTGNHVTSKYLKSFLRKHKPKAHWHIAIDGEIADTYQCLTDVLETTFERFIYHIMHENKYEEIHRKKSFRSMWHKLSAKIPVPKPKYSDFKAIGELITKLDTTAKLHLANSSAVRLAQLFPINCRLEVYSNRGVSGIDGCMSTAVGFATADRNPSTVYLVIGDLAFFYDINSLWNSQLENNNLRIMLNNNGGGGIFHTLQGFKESDVTDKYITVKHDISAKEWATEKGFIYISVTNEKELKQYMNVFTDKGVQSSILMEVFTNIEQNTKELNKYYKSINI